MRNEQNQASARPLAAARRADIAEVLRRNGSVTVAELERLYGISSMTARRDLAELERQGLARRTHGGAVLPDIAAHEDSFAKRLETANEAKEALAEAALAMITPQETIFLDSSTTTYFLARRIVEEGIELTVITNSLPVMELVAGAPTPGVELIGVGGALRRLTRSYVGPLAVSAVRSYYADRVFVSVKGVTPDGALTDADSLEAEVKRQMIAQAAESVLLLDATKLAVRGLTAIAKLDGLSAVLTHGVTDKQLAALREHNTEVKAVERGPRNGRGGRT